MRSSILLGKAKAGIENKFSVNFDYTNTQTTKELYFYYNYNAIMAQYALSQGDGYGNMLINAVNAIDLGNPLSIKTFFDTYGTHMLKSFSKGGEIEF